MNITGPLFCTRGQYIIVFKYVFIISSGQGTRLTFRVRRVLFFVTSGSNSVTSAYILRLPGLAFSRGLAACLWGTFKLFVQGKDGTTQGPHDRCRYIFGLVKIGYFMAIIN